MSKFFINRPVFAVVISVVIVLVGLIAATNLPVAQYPQITPPTISVSTTYTGADAYTVNSTVAQTIEQQVNSTQGMDCMSSISDDSGRYTLAVTFNPGTDADMDAVKVQNSVAIAAASLPSEVQTTGVTTKKSSTNTALMIFMYSPDGIYDRTFLRNYADIYLVDRIKRVEGVGDIELWGSEYTMRIWLNPEKLRALALTVGDVAEAIRRQNRQAPAGAVGAAPLSASQEKQYTGHIEGRLSTPEEFGAIVIRRDADGALSYLQDVARIETGLRSSDVTTKVDGYDGVGFSVQLTSDANAVQTVDEVRRIIAETEPDFPPGFECRVVVDNTRFIRASLREVAHTFVEALILVVFVLFIFLQDWRTTVIPSLAIPVSIIGMLAAFAALDFSVNTLTLFALVLAIGLVVDDAIVVIENVERNMERGLSPKEAALCAMNEVEGPVIATTFVLAAVFVPVAFLGGVPGILYRQFALTITISTIISTLVALTLTPALCVKLLRGMPRAHRRSLFSRFFGKFNRLFEKMQEHYRRGVIRVLRMSRLAALFLLLVCGTGAIIYKNLPSTFVPTEDMGYFSVALYLPEGTSVNHTRESIDRLAAAVMELPGVEHFVAHAGTDLLTGSNKSSAATMFVRLAPWEERTGPGQSAAELIAKTRHLGREITPEAQVMAFNPAVLPGFGRIDGWAMQLMDMSGHTDAELSDFTRRAVLALEERPVLQGVRTTYSAVSPVFDFEIDRDKANTLGIDIDAVFEAVQVNFGGLETGDFNKFGRVYKVMLESDTAWRMDADSLKFLFVRNDRGAMAPLNTLLKPRRGTAPSVVSRFNAARSVTIQGVAAAGYSSGEAIDAAEDAMRALTPEGFNIEWSGQSREEKKASGSTLRMILLAFVFAFLCLAALYESWSVPFAVLASVPTGIFGAVLSEYAAGGLAVVLGAPNPGLSNSVYMQIGIVMIVGLAAKNAILIVEFAKSRTDIGISPARAAVSAASLRFRPILMTAFTSIVGSLPLAVATGAGAAARNGMGVAVVGGMLFATLLGLYLIPAFFMMVQRVAKRFRR